MKVATKRVFLIGLLAVSGILRAGAEPTHLMDIVKTGPSLEEVQKALAEENEKVAINRTNQAGDTALALFIRNASKVKDQETKMAILKALIDNGADINVPYTINPGAKNQVNNVTLLMEAADEGDPDMIQFILNRPELTSIDAQDGRGNTALFWLIASSKVRSLDSATQKKLVQAFLAKGTNVELKSKVVVLGPNVVSIDKNNITTLLMAAIENDAPDMLEALLDLSAWKNINDRRIFYKGAGLPNTRQNMTALDLMLASSKISDPNTKIRLRDKFISRMATGGDLLSMVNSGHINLLISWLDKTKDYTPLYKTDNYGRTLLYAAVERRLLPLVEKILSIPSYSLALTWMGAGPNKQIPLMKAVEMGWAEGVQAFMKDGQALNNGLNAQDARGWTALHYATANPVYLDIIKLLVDAGADITIKNKEGKDAWDLLKGSVWFSTKDDVIGKDNGDPKTWASYRKCIKSSPCSRFGAGKNGFCCSAFVDWNGQPVK